MSSVNIHCPRCQSAQVYRHGQNPKGRDRFRYRDCHRVFQLTYTYQARKPGMKELITEMAFNEPRMMLTRMARLHGIQPCQLFKWKKQYLEGTLNAVAAGEDVVPASELAAAIKQINQVQRLLGKNLWSPPFLQH